MAGRDPVLIFAVSTRRCGASTEEAGFYAGAEVAAVELYRRLGVCALAGVRRDGRGLVLGLDLPSLDAATALVAELPTVLGGVARYRLTPCAPLADWREYLGRTPGRRAGRGEPRDPL